jgi:hypothetical protein
MTERMKIKLGKTGRGFAAIGFTDRYGSECSIQKSSIADDDAIWFGVDDASPKILASDAAKHGVNTCESVGWVEYPIPEDVLLATRMHLTRSQVRVLMPILQHFVDTGEIPE